MIAKTEKAKSLFSERYNCAQAVLVAFADEISVDEKLLVAAMAAFGGGLAGTHKNVCGAASGMLAAMSLLRGFVDPKDADAKASFNAVLKSMLKEFEEENGAINCREIILSAESSAKKDRCIRCVAFAARLVEENKGKV